jgi:hypothetical protein
MKMDFVVLAASGLKDGTPYVESQVVSRSLPCAADLMARAVGPLLGAAGGGPEVPFCIRRHWDRCENELGVSRGGRMQGWGQRYVSPQPETRCLASPMTGEACASDAGSASAF